LPHQWQVGLSASSAARLRLYSAVSYGVLGLVMFAHAPSACASARFALAVISYSRASGRAYVCCVCFVYVILFVCAKA